MAKVKVTPTQLALLRAIELGGVYIYFGWKRNNLGNHIEGAFHGAKYATYEVLCRKGLVTHGREKLLLTPAGKAFLEEQP